MRRSAVERLSCLFAEGKMRQEISSEKGAPERAPPFFSLHFSKKSYRSDEVFTFYSQTTLDIRAQW